MVRLIVTLMFMVLISCTTAKLTNEECLQDFQNDKREKYDELSNQDKFYFKLGVSMECSKYENDPKEVRKHLEEENK